MKHPLKKTLAKLCQETHALWTTLLPIVLLRVHVAPKSGLRLSPLEMTCGKPFLTTDILPEEEVNHALWYTINLRVVQKAIQDDTHKTLPVPINIQQKEQFFQK